MFCIYFFFLYYTQCNKTRTRCVHHVPEATSRRSLHPPTSVNPGPSKSLYFAKGLCHKAGRSLGESIFQRGVSDSLQSAQSTLTLELEFFLGGEAREKSSNDRTARLTQLKIKNVYELLNGGEMQDKCCTLQEKVLLC